MSIFFKYIVKIVVRQVAIWEPYCYLALAVLCMFFIQPLVARWLLGSLFGAGG